MIFRKNKKTYEATEGIGFYCEACDTMYAEFTHRSFWGNGDTDCEEK